MFSKCSHMEIVMLSRRIDAAYMALDAARERTPALQEVFRPETPERVALDRLMAVLAEVEDALSGRHAELPSAF